MSKPTRAQIEQRRLEILRIRLDGAEIWDVREYVREKERESGSPWELHESGKPLSDSQLWRYMAAADKLIAESCRASRKKLLRRHLGQRRHLYAAAVNQGDVRAALSVLDSEAKMLGLADFELSRTVEKMAKEIEELKQHAHGNTQKAAESDASGSDNASATRDASGIPSAG